MIKHPNKAVKRIIRAYGITKENRFLQVLSTDPWTESPEEVMTIRRTYDGLEK